METNRNIESIALAAIGEVIKAPDMERARWYAKHNESAYKIALAAARLSMEKTIKNINK